MTQHLNEPTRFALPAEWSSQAQPTRAIPDPRREPAHTRLAAWFGAMSTSLALCLGMPLLFVATAAPAHAQSVADVTADLRMAQDAKPMREAAEAFVASAMAGDRDTTLAMLSPALVSRMGAPAAARVLDAQILPFFQRGRALGRSTTITRTTDAQGSQGFAFYQWLEPRDGGAARPFTLYVVSEQGRLVVANVVPDRLVEGRHR